jgi:hypothetical protein
MAKQKALTIEEREDKKISLAKKKCPASHYVTARYCGNCYESSALTIPKGISVDDYLKNLVCPVCQCSFFE